MKKLISILLCCALLFGMAACKNSAAIQSVNELLSLGEKYLLDLDCEQALIQFTKVIEIEPMNPRGYTGAARAYIALGDIEKAVEVLRQGLMQPYDDTGNEGETETITLEGEASLMNAVLLDSDIESLGINADMTLPDYVDKFGLPGRTLRAEDMYETWEELEAAMQAERSRYFRLRWNNALIKSSTFLTENHKPRILSFGDSLQGIFKLQFGMSVTDVVAQLGIDSRAAGVLYSKSFYEAIKYCYDNGLTAEIELDPGYSLYLSIDFENGYLSFSEDYYDDGLDVFSEIDMAVSIRNDNYSLYAGFDELDEIDYFSVSFRQNRSDIKRLEKGE